MKVRRVVLAAVLIIGVRCASTTQMHEGGITADALRCATRLSIVRGDQHPMHFQSDTDAATFLKRRLSHEIEGLTIVEAGAPADLWLSIVTLPERICTHCAPGEKVEWAATFTLPIPKHAKAVPTEVLLLSGRVTPPRRPLPAFIRAAKKIRADHPCRRDMPPNSTQQLSRPGAGPAAELP